MERRRVVLKLEVAGQRLQDEVVGDEVISKAEQVSLKSAFRDLRRHLQSEKKSKLKSKKIIADATYQPGQKRESCSLTEKKTLRRDVRMKIDGSHRYEIPHQPTSVTIDSIPFSRDKVDRVFAVVTDTETSDNTSTSVVTSVSLGVTTVTDKSRTIPREEGGFLFQEEEERVSNAQFIESSDNSGVPSRSETLTDESITKKFLMSRKDGSQLAPDEVHDLSLPDGAVGTETFTKFFERGISTTTTENIDTNTNTTQFHVNWDIGSYKKVIQLPTQIVDQPYNGVSSCILSVQETSLGTAKNVTSCSSDYEKIIEEKGRSEVSIQKQIYVREKTWKKNEDAELLPEEVIAISESEEFRDRTLAVTQRTETVSELDQGEVISSETTKQQIISGVEIGTTANMSHEGPLLFGSTNHTLTSVATQYHSISPLIDGEGPSATIMGPPSRTFENPETLTKTQRTYYHPLETMTTVQENSGEEKVLSRELPGPAERGIARMTSDVTNICFDMFYRRKNRTTFLGPVADTLSHSASDYTVALVLQTANRHRANSISNPTAAAVISMLCVAETLTRCKIQSQRVKPRQLATGCLSTLSSAFAPQILQRLGLTGAWSSGILSFWMPLCSAFATSSPKTSKIGLLLRTCVNWITNYYVAKIVLPSDLILTENVIAIAIVGVITREAIRTSVMRLYDEISNSTTLSNFKVNWAPTMKSRKEVQKMVDFSSKMLLPPWIISSVRLFK